MTTSNRLNKKITFTLLAGQSLFSASMIMAFTIGSIIAVELAGNDRWVGVPSTLVVIGAALMAYPIGRLMDRVGRRIGLSLGYLLGITGMLVTGFAVISQSLPVYLLGIFGLGLTKGVLDQGRYAAAEASPESKRARAISWVVLGGTAGSILGPSLIKATGNTAISFGMPEMSGPWFAGALFFLLSLLLINIFLRPDPQQIARERAATRNKNRLSPADTGHARSTREIFQQPAVKMAAAALIFGQLAMVVVMTMTPLHMHRHSHGLGPISWVIMAHTLGMFGLSFVTGWMVDRLGRAPLIIAGGLVLAFSCAIAPLNAGVPWLIVSLFLLGLGWNFCFVAGSALLSDALRPEERGRIQGLTDTMINAVSGMGSIGGGLIFAASGYLSISWLSVLFSLVPVAMVLLLRKQQQQAQLEGVGV